MDSTRLLRGARLRGDALSAVPAEADGNNRHGDGESTGATARAGGSG